MTADIKRAVCAHYHLPLEEMDSRRRARWIARPRQIAMSLSFLLTDHSKKHIGRLFGVDHSTVIHSIKASAKRRQEDRETREAFRAITKALLLP